MNGVKVKFLLILFRINQGVDSGTFLAVMKHEKPFVCDVLYSRVCLFLCNFSSTVANDDNVKPTR